MEVLLPGTGRVRLRARRACPGGPGAGYGCNMEPAQESGEVFEATAEGILRFVATTRPTPDREAVVEHIRTLVDEGLLDEPHVDRLISAGFDELLD